MKFVITLLRLCMTGELFKSWRKIRNFVLLLLVWEVIGQLELIASGALPSISEIIIRIWQDWADYPRHIGATLYGSIVGFIIGNLLAIAAGIVFAISPTALKLFRGLNITAFAHLKLSLVLCRAFMK